MQEASSWHTCKRERERERELAKLKLAAEFAALLAG